MLKITMKSSGPKAATVQLYGEIDESAPRRLAAELKAAGELDELVVHVHSGGGDAFGGVALRSILARQKGKVIAVVDGIAASAASIILTGASEVHMAAGSFQMVHDPAALVLGVEDDMTAMAQALGKIADEMASLYAQKTGKTPAEMRTLMRSETWLNAQESVDLGLADLVLEQERIAASVEPGRFLNAPAELTAPPPAPKGRQPTPDEAAERQRDAAIAAACAEFGDLSLASTYIEAGLSIADVEQILAEKTEERDARADEIARLKGAATKAEKERMRQADIAAGWSRVIAQTTPKHLRPYLREDLTHENG